MIRLSNGHEFKYMVASGALGFDGKGWFWEKILVWLGFIKPELFTVVIKTLTFDPRKGNLCWWKPSTWLPFSPWSCVRFLPGGAINKVGLTNPGFLWWIREVAPKIDFKKYPIVVSIWGTEEECVIMARMLNQFDIVAIEWNDSCPNSGHALKGTEASIRIAKMIKKASRHPLIYKGSVEQAYIEIAEALVGIVEAFAFNSVKSETVFPEKKKGKLWRLERKVGGGGGGVSGKPAQKYNWLAVRKLARTKSIPVICPSIMEYEDIKAAESFGAEAVSFGAIHLCTPWAPTSFVERKENS